jgi:hypothetical protein
MGITGHGNKGWEPLQKGLREYLLCSDCEQHINEKYEKPFLKQWTDVSPIPDKIEKDATFVGNYDYRTFKLFHLSILFRASVTTVPTFAEVCLGKHEQRIRELLLADDPGKDWEYPIVGFAVLNWHGKVERRFISRPILGRYEGHITYGQIYGGVMWWILVSSHRNDAFTHAALQPSGQMTFIAESWGEIGVLRDASRALNQIHL